MAADASIRVDTRVDNSDLKVLQKEFDTITKKLEGLRSRSAKLEMLGGSEKQFESIGYDCELLEERLEAVKARMADINQQNTDKATSGFVRVRNACSNLFKSVEKGTKKSNGLLSTMGSRLKGIALSLLVFNWISKGFNALVASMKEGFQNLIQYSVDYNNAMSDMKSRAAELKNSLAVAFEPIVTAIIPYITQLISWLNEAMVWIAKFQAIISGKSTYTKAKKQVVDYANSLKTASSSAKGALAAFDEINVLSKDETSGTAGGEVTGADAFETVSITEEDVSMFDRVKEILKEISGLLLAIGLLMAVFGASGPLATFFGALLLIAGVLEFIVSYMDAWANGISFENLNGMLVGLLAVITAIYLLFGPLAAGIVAIVAGIMLVIVAIRDMLNNGINTQNMITLIIGLVAVLIGIFVAFGSTTAVVVAAVIGAIAMVVLAIKDMINNGMNMQNCILLVIGVVTALIAIFVAFGSTAAMIVGAIVAVIAIFAGMIAIAGNGEEAISSLRSMCKNFANFFKKLFAGDIKGAMESLKLAGKDLVNVVIIAFESLINCIIKGLNWLIDKINSISFDVPDWVPIIGGKTLSPNLSHINEVSLPRLATGGITNGPTKALIGESGKEAVLPLENNTEWMDVLADKIGSDRSIVIRFEGSLAELGRILKPVIDTENGRVGATLAQI